MSDYLDDNLNGSYGNGMPYDNSGINPVDNTPIIDNRDFGHGYDNSLHDDAAYGRPYNDVVDGDFRRPPIDDRTYDNPMDNRGYDRPVDDRDYDRPRDDRAYDRPIDDRGYDRSRDDYDRLRDDRDFDRPRDDRDYDRSRDNRGGYDRPYDPRDDRQNDKGRAKDKGRNDKSLEKNDKRPNGPVGLKQKLADNKMIVIFAVMLVVLITLICCVSKYVNSSSNGKITVYYKGFSSPSIQYQLSEGKWVKSPGVKMDTTTMEGYTHEFSVDLGSSKYMLACFHDEDGNTDNNNGKYYKFTAGTFCFDDGTITQMGEEVVVPGGSLKIESFTVTPSENVFPGDELTLEAKVSGGSPKYSYSFGYFNDAGEETVLQSFAYESSIKWTPEQSGTYKLYVKVKDNDINVRQEDISDFVVSGISITNIETSQSSPAEKKSNITLTAVIDNTIGADKLTCKYEISNGSDTETINASSSGVADWKPSKAGDYKIKCIIDDGDGHTAEKEIDFTITEKSDNNNDNNNDGNNSDADYVTIYYKGYENAHIYYQIEDGEWSKDVGTAMTQTNEKKGYEFKTTIKLNGARYINACFNNGNDKWDNNNGGNYYFEAGTYTFKDGKIKQISNQDDGGASGNTITIYYGGYINNPFLHYKIGNEDWGQYPDEQMENASGIFKFGYNYMVTIDLGDETTLTGCFTDGQNWDNNNGNDYYFSAPGTYYVKDGNIKDSALF